MRGVLLLLLVSLLGGCAATKPLPISQQLENQAVKVINSAEKIEGEAKQIDAKTPPAAAPAIKFHTNAIRVETGSLKRSGEQLDALVGQIETLQRRLDKAEGATAAMYRRLAWLGVIAIGLSVAIGVIAKSFKLSAAGVAGGAAVLAVATLMGVAIKIALWVGLGLVGSCVCWILVEWMIRGSFKKAILSSPTQDWKELMELRGTNG